jgi:hypothetical protein
MASPPPSMVRETPAAPAASPVLPYGNWTPALFQPHRRSIGGIVANVTIEEQHTDELQITDHPVEGGAPVSDHAFKRPVQVNITAGWSTALAFDLSAESGVYGLLLSWQASLMPFDVITGKRSYQNMLIERLVVSTDNHNEYTLMAQIMCREVIIVATQTAQVQGMSSSANEHQEPDKTAPATGNGDKPTTKPAETASSTANQTTHANSSDAQLNEKGIGDSTKYSTSSSDSGIGGGGKVGMVSQNQQGQEIPIAPAVTGKDFVEPPPPVSTGNQAGQVIPIPPAPPQIISP